MSFGPSPVGTQMHLKQIERAARQQQMSAFPDFRLMLGVMRTFLMAVRMSAFDPKRTFAMDVRYGPLLPTGAFVDSMLCAPYTQD